MQFRQYSVCHDLNEDADSRWLNIEVEWFCRTALLNRHSNLSIWVQDCFSSVYDLDRKCSVSS
jgi:hypothetical protein